MNIYKLYIYLQYLTLLQSNKVSVLQATGESCSDVNTYEVFTFVTKDQD
jgi:hypothetical protein